VIKGLFIMASVMFVCLVIVSCEFTESQLVKEQAITFEQEIAYRQRKENELEGELKRANETIKKLERQLECKNDLPDKTNTKQ
jgi:septal ring factor EnvC (AmiA/AmiB activator)